MPNCIEFVLDTVISLHILCIQRFQLISYLLFHNPSSSLTILERLFIKVALSFGPAFKVSGPWTSIKFARKYVAEMPRLLVRKQLRVRSSADANAPSFPTPLIFTAYLISFDKCQVYLFCFSNFFLLWTHFFVFYYANSYWLYSLSALHIEKMSSLLLFLKFFLLLQTYFRYPVLRFFVFNYANFQLLHNMHSDKCQVYLLLEYIFFINHIYVTPVFGIMFLTEMINWILFKGLYRFSLHIFAEAITLINE